MALLVLISTVSFTVSSHYCGTYLVDKAVFSEAHKCGMEKDLSPIEACEVTKKSCCKDEVTHVKGQDTLDKISHDVTFQKMFLEVFVYSYVNLFESLDQYIIPFKEYSPPLLVRDVHLLDEVFLI